MASAEAYVRAAAITMRDAMLRAGLRPPADDVLVPALVATVLALLLGCGLLVALVAAPARSARDALLIVGASPPAAAAPAPGKTCLFRALRAGRAPPHGTLPTQAPTDATFVLHAPAPREAALARPVRVVDFPGHARLRPRLPYYLASARAIVFVVDASAAAFAKSAREAADLLHDVLASPGIARAAVPVLVFCNKADMPGCVAPPDVRTKLEAELERARKAKAAALSGAGNAVIRDIGAGEDAEEKLVFLGYDDEAFNFDHIANDVQFAAGSAKNLDVSAVVDFAQSLW